MQKHKGLFQNDKIVSLIFFICRAKIFKEFIYMCTLRRTILPSQLYDMHYTGGIQFRRNHFPVTPRHYGQKSKDRATLS